MKRYKGIIFDLDGVIVYTDKFHYLSWKKLADEEGIYFDKEINNRLRGVSRMDSLNIILERSSKEYSSLEKEEMAGRKNNYYKQYLDTMTKDDVEDDTRKTLKVLKERGYKLAIGSSSKNTKYILSRVGLLNAFDAISDGTNITKSKPDPEVFLKAAQMIKEEPKDLVIMEDAYSGIDAGIKGGFDTIAINQATSYDKPTYKVERFKDILNILN